MEKNKRKKALIAFITLFIVLFLLIIIFLIIFNAMSKNPKPKLDERGFPIYEKKMKNPVDDANYYVSVKDGNDNNDGTKERPFKTITKARDVIRDLIKNKADDIKKDIKVAIKGGRYNFKKELSFNNLDNLKNNHKIIYTSYNNEEVSFSGGVNLKASDFKELSKNDLERLNENARKNVKVVNLLEKGITLDEIGMLYSIGGYPSGKRYGEKTGYATELFYDDKRMQLAKYPNDDFAKIGDIIDYGEAGEHVPDIINWDTSINPRPPKFLVDDDMKSHMAKWKKPTSSLNSIWTYGYFYWDWADVSSPVKDFNKNLGELDLKYSSRYGIKKDGKYFVYNAFEELDSVGEYYLDRESGNLYIYFPNNYNKNSDISLSLLNKSIIKADKANNITIDGITIELGKENGITMKGNNITLENITVKNIGNFGISVEGYNNKILDNEVKNIGKSAVVVGNKINYKVGNIENDIRKDGLIIENSLVKNNYIHNYGEISRSGIAGISILGVGNKISHNEVFDSPFTGILYEGNEHIIEYNYIHHVVKMSSDAGAIYSGRNLSYFGNVIRYNAITDIGGKNFTPNGIYFDDCLAGQVAYGNLLANIKGSAFLIGGGREHKIYNNTIINANIPITYDARAYDGLTNGWYKKNVNSPTSPHWMLLEDAKKLYNIWINDEKSARIIKESQSKSQSNYSKILDMAGYDKKDKPESAATPNGHVFNNIVVSKDKFIGKISDVVKKYAKIENNNIYNLLDDKILKSFDNYNIGNYKILKNSIIAKENKNYNYIPYHLIGRIND